jgi:hypothetical protein
MIKIFKIKRSIAIKMNYIKIFLILSILHHETLNTLPTDSITVIKNSVFNKPASVNNNCAITNLDINGNITFGNINQQQNIKVLISNNETAQFVINNLPILPDTTPINKRMLICIDDKNKLYLYEEKNNGIQKNLLAGDDLTAINIDTFDINQTDNSLPLISSVDQDGLAIDLWFGDKNNNVIFLSPVILAVNRIAFNNPIDYPISVSNTSGVIINGNLVAKNLIINTNILTHNTVSFEFQNILSNGNLNISSNNTVLVQGDIQFNDTVSLGGLPTNLTMYTAESDNINALFFLGTDNNQNLCATSVLPSLATLNSEQIISKNENLSIFPKNKNLKIGNLASNITIDSDLLLLEGPLLIANNRNTINFIFNNKNTFLAPTTINSLDNAFCIASNNQLSIEGDSNFYAITFNKDIYFNSLPVIPNFSAYLVIAYENNIGYLRIEPIAQSLKKIEAIQQEFYITNQAIYDNIKLIENKIEKSKTTYCTLKNSNNGLIKKNKQYFKRLLNCLKKNKDVLRTKHKKLLQKLQEELL